MLYITGKQERLSDLREREGFEGSLTEYAEKFNQINKNLNLQIANSAQTLPTNIPLFPVGQSIPLNDQRYEIASEIGTYSPAERETLREMQEQQIEMPALIATKNLLNDYGSNLSWIRSKLDEPLIRTPWKFWNDNATVNLVPDMISEGLFYKGNSIQRSLIYNNLNQLERDMLAMDALQMQLHSIRNQNGGRNIAVKQNLQRQIRDLSAQIKKQISPKIQDELSKHLNSCYTADELKKMTRSSYGEKLARKGKMKTSYLDLSTRSGLNRMRDCIPLFKNLGTLTGRSSTCIGWASLGYDSLEAAINKDFENSIRIATSGAVGIWAGATVFAYVIGYAGTTFLVCTPLGWAVVVIGGALAANFVGTQAAISTDCMIEGAINSIKENFKELQNDQGSKSYIQALIEYFTKSLVNDYID